MYSGDKSVFASNSSDLANTVNGVDIYNSKFIFNLGRHLSELPTMPKKETHTRLDVFCSMNDLDNEDAIHLANKFICWESVKIKDDIKIVTADQIKRYTT